MIGVVERYRKKPVVVEAMEHGPNHAESGMCSTWVNANGGDANMRHDPEWGYVLDIVTLEGTMTATGSDWIIRGTAGEFYPCKPDIFRAIYEPADS